MGSFLFKRSQFWQLWRSYFHVDDARLHTDLAGIELRNPVGFAPGFDKDCEMLQSMEMFGFGYCVPGSIQLHASDDDNNPPRFRRVSEVESLIECVKIPSKGAEYSVGRLTKFKDRRGLRIIPVIENFTIDDAVDCYRRIIPFVDGVEISLRCPNEPGNHYEQNFLDPDVLGNLLRRIQPIKSKPLFVKMRNYVSPSERENRLELANICLKNGVDGITMPGSMVVKEPKISAGSGILSGRAILSKTIGNVAELYRETQGKMVIKARGGISHPVDAFEAIKAGASTVELLTGIVYKGPSVARSILLGLLRLIEVWGYKSIAEAIGTYGGYRAASTIDAIGIT